MYEISETLDKGLQSLPFIEYLKRMYDWLEGIQHRPKSNSAYDECRAIARHIKYRIVKEYKLSWEDFDMKIGKNLRQSEEVLDLYGHGESDKRKGARIKEFIDDYTYDLHSFIRARDRQEQNPGTTIHEDEI